MNAYRTVLLSVIFIALRGSSMAQVHTDWLARTHSVSARRLAVAIGALASYYSNVALLELFSSRYLLVDVDALKSLKKFPKIGTTGPQLLCWFSKKYNESNGLYEFRHNGTNLAKILMGF